MFSATLAKRLPKRVRWSETGRDITERVGPNGKVTEKVAGMDRRAVGGSRVSAPLATCLWLLLRHARLPCPLHRGESCGVESKATSCRGAQRGPKQPGQRATGIAGEGTEGRPQRRVDRILQQDSVGSLRQAAAPAVRAWREPWGTRMAGAGQG